MRGGWFDDSPPAKEKNLEPVLRAGGCDGDEGGKATASWLATSSACAHLVEIQLAITSPWQRLGLHPQRSHSVSPLRARSASQLSASSRLCGGVRVLLACGGGSPLVRAICSGVDAPRSSSPYPSTTASRWASPCMSSGLPNTPI